MATKRAEYYSVQVARETFFIDTRCVGWQQEAEDLAERGGRGR